MKLQVTAASKYSDTEARHGILETTRVAPTGASKRQAIFHHRVETDARNDDHGPDGKRGNVLVQSVAFPTTYRDFVFRDGNLGLLARSHC